MRLHVEQVAFLDVDDDVDVPFLDFLGREGDLGVVVALVVVERLDLVRVGLDAVGVVDLLDLEGEDPADVVGLDGIVSLDLDFVDEGTLLQQEGDHLAVGAVRDIGLHVREVARPVDGPDVGREVLFGVEFALRALENVVNDGALDPPVARQIDPGDDLCAGNPGEDVPGELCREGPRVFDPRALGEEPRDHGARFHGDGLGVEAHAVAELGEASHDHVVGPDLFSDGERQRLVGGLSAHERGELLPRDDLDRTDLAELQGHAVVDGVSQKRGIPFAVDVEGEDGDPLRGGLGRGGQKAGEEQQQGQGEVFSRSFHVTHPSRFFRHEARCSGPCGLPATGCG